MDFALHLGYTEEQVEQELATEQDPILAILNLYKRQGGNAKEFLQVMLLHVIANWICHIIILLLGYYLGVTPGIDFL